MCQHIDRGSTFKDTSLQILNLKEKNNTHRDTNTRGKSFGFHWTCVSRLSSVGSLRSSLVFPFSVSRLTYNII